MAAHTEFKKQEYSAAFLFAGIGGGALGFQQAKAHFKNMVGVFHTVIGIDVDPEACSDFEKLTCAKSACMDLFSTEQYEAFHGHKPPEGWREKTPADIREACGGVAPDVWFTSAPCKGFSGLLPNKSAISAKYQALNRLTVRGMKLILEAFPEEKDLPAAILFENVPRITTRGEALLREVKELLFSYGYLFHEGYHDCGEIGGLGQKRKRYLLIARNPKKLTAFIYQPPKLRVKSIGEVIGPLPLPDNPSCGPMHRLPRLQWKTWVRLALIPAGGDWRDLEKIASERYRLEWIPRGGGAYGVQDWEKPSAAIIGNASIKGSNAVSVADVRLKDRDTRHGNVYRVVNDSEPAPTIVGSRFGSGAPAYADPRAIKKIDVSFDNAFKVTEWDKRAGTVTGGDGPSNGAISVADPRLNLDKDSFNGTPGLYGVNDWKNPAPSITGGAKVSSSNTPAAIADPRITSQPRPGAMGVILWEETAPAVTGSANPTSSNTPSAVADPRYFDNSYAVQAWCKPAGVITGAKSPSCGNKCVADPRFSCKARPGTMEVQKWDKASDAVVGTANVHAGGAAAVADPRLGCKPRNGTMKVQDWNKQGDTVTSAGDVHAGGASAVADPRIPADNDRPDPVPVIISLDNTWHRPLSTLELAVLQSFPSHLPDGTPLVLSGNSDGKWRERIGNAVPPETARAIATEILKSLLMNGKQDFILHSEPVWVRPVKEVRA